MNGKNLERQFKPEQTISHKALQVELKWKKNGKNTFCNGYGKGSKKTQMRHNKSP